MSIETNEFSQTVKLTDPKELKLIWDGDRVTKVLLDGIELPFNCEIEVKRDTITMLHGPLAQLMGLGRGPTYLEGDCEITLTVKPRRLLVEKKEIVE